MQNIGEALKYLPSVFDGPAPLVTPIRDAAMSALFFQNGFFDYQRKYSENGLINRTHIDFGNYNFGVVAAAAGYSLNQAFLGAGVANLFGWGDKSGQFFGNPKNIPFIAAGFLAYKNGKIGPGR